jgi:DNA-binding beta-propeller fold protein YncE
MAVRAPDLPTNASWLNVSRPLTPQDLAGRVVLLDFWTYCCINCLHTLPVLARLERKLAGEPFLAIGVHSPKFPNERDEAMVREAVRRHGVTHPVVIDSGHSIWRQYAIHAWPTLVIVDPLGRIVGQASGEPDEEPLESVIVRVLEAARGKGVMLASAPLPLSPERAVAGSLAYPGKALARGNRLFVADTGHHQVVAFDLAADGSAVERRRFGEGAPGLADGAGLAARFTHPNGLALDEAAGILYVADTGNHTLRRIALSTGEVSTAAGTGAKGHGLPVGQRLAGAHAALRSPWDLAWDAARRTLYVAMAGTHQLYAFDPASSLVGVLAGSGAEARQDGAFDVCSFAQPSGLALAGDRLYVADSEISCVREADLRSKTVRTIAGGDLFTFGDQDGVGDAVRLQHPIGIAAAEGGGRLFLADSFNHKIKEVEPGPGRVRTLYGNGEPLHADLAIANFWAALPRTADKHRSLFFEPEGLSVEGSRLFVADTNNHRIVAIDLRTDAARIVAGGN